MRFEKRRREWLLGRWTAKRLLPVVEPRCEGVGLAEISIENEVEGAPFVSVAGVGRLEGCLSISHREDLAFCAYCQEPIVKIGADLEWVERRSEAFVSDYLTQGEAGIAIGLSGEERDRWVALAWSAKEAVLKALRIGLRVDTRAIEVVGNPFVGGMDGWKRMGMRTELPGTKGMAVWGRVEGKAVMTMACVGMEDGVELRQVFLNKNTP